MSRIKLVRKQNGIEVWIDGQQERYLIDDYEIRPLENGNTALTFNIPAMVEVEQIEFVNGLLDAAEGEPQEQPEEEEEA